jgi:hypothetical protein
MLIQCGIEEILIPKYLCTKVHYIPEITIVNLNFLRRSCNFSLIQIRLRQIYLGSNFNQRQVSEDFSQRFKNLDLKRPSLLML